MDALDELTLAILLGEHAQQHGYLAARELVQIGTSAVDKEARIRLNAALERAARINGESTF